MHAHKDIGNDEQLTDISRRAKNGWWLRQENCDMTAFNNFANFTRKVKPAPNSSVTITKIDPKVSKTFREC